MDQSSLLAETNALLKQLIDFYAEQQAEAEKLKAEFEKSSEERTAQLNATFQDLMKKQGITEPVGIDNSEDMWMKRMDEAQAKSRERLELLQAKDAQYKEDLLNELKIQSELLNKIVEKLNR